MHIGLMHKICKIKSAHTLEFQNSLHCNQLVLYLGHCRFKLIAIYFNFNSTQRKFTETHILLFLCTSWKRLAACHAGSQILRCRRFSGVFLLRKLLAGRSPDLLLPATCACFFSGEKCELRRKECVCGSVQMFPPKPQQQRFSQTAWGQSSRCQSTARHTEA